MTPTPRQNRALHASIITLLLAMVLLKGCAQPIFTKYEELHNATRQPDYVRVPVIFIPGIKGTMIVRGANQKVVWGRSGRVAFFSGFDDLMLDYQKQNSSSEFAEYYKNRAVYPSEVLESYGLGLQWFTFHHAVVYRELLDFLRSEAGGEFKIDSAHGGSLFLLPYDWRLDNRIAAAKLALELPHYRRQYEQLLLVEQCELLKKKKDSEIKRCSPEALNLPKVRNEYNEYLKRTAAKYPELFVAGTGDQPQIKFNIVAHSMGGLVAQYFISQLGGHADIHRLITLGTPSLGAMDAMKAISEGEYPETIWSSLLGIGWFPKRATNYITLSFPSMYQLLPRYAGAFEGAVTREKLGLGRPASLLSPVSEVAVWERYGLVPDWEAAGYKGDPEKSLVVFREHLSIQLLSAACFHDSLDGRVDKACDEPGRAASAIEFLLHVERDASTRARWQEARGELNRHRDTAESKAARPGRIVYGGHCQPTVTRAKFDEQAPGIHFLQSSAGDDQSFYMGDGRVPLPSAEYRRPVDNLRGSFFICADHIGLVKNESFRYNLLRILLTDVR